MRERAEVGRVYVCVCGRRRRGRGGQAQSRDVNRSGQRLLLAVLCAGLQQWTSTVSTATFEPQPGPCNSSSKLGHAARSAAAIRAHMSSNVSRPGRLMHACHSPVCCMPACTPAHTLTHWLHLPAACCGCDMLPSACCTCMLSSWYLAVTSASFLR